MRRLFAILISALLAVPARATVAVAPALDAMFDGVPALPVPPPVETGLLAAPEPPPTLTPLPSFAMAPAAVTAPAFKAVPGRGWGEFRRIPDYGNWMLLGVTVSFFGGAAAGGMNGLLFLGLAFTGLASLVVSGKVHALNSAQPLARAHRRAIKRVDLTQTHWGTRGDALERLHVAPGDVELARTLAMVVRAETHSLNVRKALAKLGEIGAAAVPTLEALAAEAPQAYVLDVAEALKAARSVPDPIAVRPLDPADGLRPLLDDAARALAVQPSTLAERLAADAIRHEKAGLEAALAAKDPEASAVAAERLRQLLRR